MLRGMVFKNFVNFEDRIDIDFKKSPSIFVGASSTGKTAALELIRRCMDSKLNASLTNRLHNDKIAYVFCEFKIDLNNYGTTVITGMIVDGQHENSNHKSIIKRIKEEKESNTATGGQKEETLKDAVDTENDWLDEFDKKENGEHFDWSDKDTIFHKVIIYKYQELLKFRSETYLEGEDGKVVDLGMNVRLPEKFLSGILDKIGSDTIEDLIYLFDEQFVGKVIEEIKRRQCSKNIYHKCPKLWEEMEKIFVGILPTRGLGTIQWTKSDSLKKTLKSKNYKDTCTQAEILNKLMESADIDVRKEEEIFSFLTSPDKFIFEKTTGTTGSIVVKHNGREFPLLKTSIGIVDAKQFSLLMAHAKFKTICFEEPDRGMHPQMIERLREVLHRECHNKTVIVVTHSPFLIDSMSLENIFIFSKQDNVSFVKNVVEIQGYGKTLKIIEGEELKKILFSSKVLLVEGKSDKTALQAIFRHCFQSYSDFEKVMSYQIISMEGKSRKDVMSTFCKNINLKCSLLLDRDAFIDTDGTGRITKIRGGFKYQRKNISITEFIDDPNGFDKLSEHLRSRNIFIWKDGDLEAFLLSNGKKHICDFFEVNHQETTSDIKKGIKKKLNDGLSKEKAREFADIVKDLEDLNNLKVFLGLNPNEESSQSEQSLSAEQT